MPGVTWSSSETPTKNPSPSNSCVVPSTTTVAPSAAAPVTYEATLSRCSRVISGPISLAASVPSPMTSAPMRLRTASTSSSATSPTATSTDTAMQRSPAEPYAAETAASAAPSRSASGMTTMWFFAPPRACTRLPFAEARS